MNSVQTLIQKQQLFTAREGGYHHYRVPGIIVTPCGTVLAHCEARKGHGSDWDPIDIQMRRSGDGGKTWYTPTTPVSCSDYGADGPISNFVLIPDRVTGDIHALFCHNYSRAFHMRSTDDGKTFSQPTDITETFAPLQNEYSFKVLAIGPGHGIQHSSGRLIAPIWISPGTGAGGHRPNRCGVIYSEDHGKTWVAGQLLPDVFNCMNETEAVELTDGTVLFNTRAFDDGIPREDRELRRCITISPDGTGNWSTSRRDPALKEPICFGSICRVSREDEDDRNRIVFSNPDTLEQTMTKWARDRKNLTIKMSYDECRTWPVSKVLEPGPSGYSDLAVLPDKTILCIYECGMLQGQMCDTANLTLARFDERWLTTEVSDV